MIFFLSIVPFSFSEQIPEWIKNDSDSWINNDISDSEFLTTIQFLLNNNMISVDVSNTSGFSADIPKWLKTHSSWWINNDISDSEFLHVI